MSVYKRGEIWWVRFEQNGVKIRQSARTKSKKDALEYEAELRRQVYEDQHATRMGRTLKRTFGQALVEWIERDAPKSMYKHIRAVRPYMEDVWLHQSVEAAAKMKKAMLGKGLSPLTINRRLAVVRRVLNVAYGELHWLKEPLGIKISPLMMSEKGYARTVFLTKEQAGRLIDAIEDETARTFITAICLTGMRKGEAFNLQASDFIDGCVHVRKSKNFRQRIIPISPEHHYIFENLPFPISEWELRKAFDVARKAIAMPDLRIHDLRHTFASWLAEDPTIALTTIRDILGHSNLRMTDRYVHLSIEHLREAVDAVFAVTGNEPGFKIKNKKKER